MDREEPAAATFSRTEGVTAIAASAVLVLLVFVTMPHPVRPFWSLFFFAEYPWPLRMLLLLAPVVVAATLSGRLVPALARAARALTGATRAAPFLLWAGSFALFWLLREHRHWGDAGYTIDILEGSGDVSPLGRYFWKEPGDRLAATLFTWLGRHAGLGAETSVALLNTLAGSLFVVVLWSCSGAARHQPCRPGVRLRVHALRRAVTALLRARRELHARDAGDRCSSSARASPSSKARARSLVRGSSPLSH